MEVFRGYLEVIKVTAAKAGLSTVKSFAYIGGVVIVLIVFKPVRKEIYQRLHGKSKTYQIAVRSRRGRWISNAFDDLKSNLPAGNTANHLHVVDVGLGVPENIDFYPEGCRLTCIVPKTYMCQNARKVIDDLPNARLVQPLGWDLSSLEDDSVDVLVSNLILCSVGDLESALAQIWRVLKPGGKFVFLEHMRAGKSSPAYPMQQRWRRYWAVALFGCQLDRKIYKTMRGMAFSEIQHEKFRAGTDNWGFYLIRPQVVGMATKSA